MKIDDTDKKIIKLLQNNFPLASRPFRHIATTLVLEESEVIERVKAMKETDIIRRIGPLYNPKSFGLKTILIAIKTNPANEMQVVGFLNDLDGITHNYKRDCEYDLWFTFAYKSETDLNQLINRLKSNYKIDDVIKLPATKQYKLKTEFKL